MPKALLLFLVKGDKDKLIDNLSKESMKGLLAPLHQCYLETREKFRARIVKLWMNNVKDERISAKGVNYPGNALELLLEYNFILKYPSSLGSIKSLSTVTIPVTHFVWIRKRSNLLVFFDVFKKGVLRVLAEALSYKIYGNPGLISQFTFSFDDFESLESWVVRPTNSETGGFLKRAVFADSIVAGSHVDEISVKRAALERESIYTDVKGKSRRWLSLTLVTPLIEEIGVRLSCRFVHDGSVIIYTPIQDLLYIDIFLSKLEDILALSK